MLEVNKIRLLKCQITVGFNTRLRSMLFTHIFVYLMVYSLTDRLCGLVVRVLDYRSGGLGSIPGTTRFPEKKKENK
jgi:hypothetical protein